MLHPAASNVNPGIIQGNTGVFTVQVTISKDFDTAPFDLSSAKITGVSANIGTKGLEQQAKKDNSNSTVKISLGV